MGYVFFSVAICKIFIMLLKCTGYYTTKYAGYYITKYTGYYITKYTGYKNTHAPHLACII